MQHAYLEQRSFGPAEDDGERDDQADRQYQVPGQRGAVANELQIAGVKYGKQPAQGLDHERSSLPVSFRNRSSRLRGCPPSKCCLSSSSGEPMAMMRPSSMIAMMSHRKCASSM